MGKYRSPNMRKYFESIERLITYKTLPMTNLTEYLYNIVKYNLISSYENYYLYIQYQLKMKPLSNETISIDHFTKQLYILAYFSLNTKKSTPMFEDHLTYLIKYLELNVNNISHQDLEDILLFLCAADCLIRYSLLTNTWGNTLRPDIVETLNNMYLNEKFKTQKDVRFEELASKFGLKLVTNARTNLISVDYILALKDMVDNVKLEHSGYPY
jgi:hypothetical protein